MYIVSLTYHIIFSACRFVVKTRTSNEFPLVIRTPTYMNDSKIVTIIIYYNYNHNIRTHFDRTEIHNTAGIINRYYFFTVFSFIFYDRIIIIIIKIRRNVQPTEAQNRTETYTQWKEININGYGNGIIVSRELFQFFLLLL